MAASRTTLSHHALRLRRHAHASVKHGTQKSSQLSFDGPLASNSELPSEASCESQYRRCLDIHDLYQATNRFSNRVVAVVGS